MNEGVEHGPCGAMDNASDYGSEDSRFESWQGRLLPPYTLPSSSALTHLIHNITVSPLAISHTHARTHARTNISSVSNTDNSFSPLQSSATASPPFSSITSHISPLRYWTHPNHTPSAETFTQWPTEFYQLFVPNHWIHSQIIHPLPHIIYTLLTNLPLITNNTIITSNPYSYKPHHHISLSIFPSILLVLSHFTSPRLASHRIASHRLNP